MTRLKNLIQTVRERIYESAGRLARHLVRRTTDTATVHGEVEVRLHDSAALREAARDRGLNYDELDKPEKLELTRAVEPKAVRTVENSTLEEYHEHLADLADPATAATAETASHLAVGTDGTAASASDTGLIAEVTRVAVTDSQRTGRDLFTSTFLDTSEANGNTLREVALASDATAGQGIEFNRAVIADLPKTSEDTATIDVTLQYRA